jgi:group I intron endonuclease
MERGNNCGVYMIFSTIKPDRFYIGSSVNLRKRLSTHKALLKNNNHSSVKLQYHVNKYGLEDLSFSVVEYCDKSILISKEQLYIDIFNPWFNINKTAKVNLCKKKNTEEQNRALSDRMKKLWEDPSYREKQRISRSVPRPERRGIPSHRKGKHLTEEHKRNISESRIGKPHPFTLSPNATIAKREKWLGSGNPNFGGITNEKHLNNIAKAAREWYESPQGQEQFKRMWQLSKEINTGKPCKPETRAKIGAKARERAKFKKQGGLSNG